MGLNFEKERTAAEAAAAMQVEKGGTKDKGVSMERKVG
jgi:hypothetical protein